MEPDDLRGAIEAILFAAGEPVQLEELTQAFPEEGEEAITSQLDAIERSFRENGTGFRLEKAAGGFRFATRPELDPYLRKFFARKNEGRLSMAALETLAIIAYRQPITAPEISEIRGVNAAGVLRTLMERRMIRISGRKNVVGSPFLYRTTREFLTHFGLNDIRDLPRLEEFGDLLGENISEELIAEMGGDTLPPASASEDDDADTDAAAAPAHETRAETAPDAEPSPAIELPDDASDELAGNEAAADDELGSGEESGETVESRTDESE